MRVIGPRGGSVSCQRGADMTRPDRSDDEKLDQEFIDKAAAARAHADPEKAARYEASLARAREQRRCEAPAGGAQAPCRSERVSRLTPRPIPRGRRRRASRENVQRWPAGSTALYCRSPYSKSVGSITMVAPLLRARSQWARASSTRTVTEWLAAPGRGARRSPWTSPTMSAPSPRASCGAVVLPDADPLDEPERCAEPGDRLADVGIDEYGDDGRRRHRAVGPHAVHSSVTGCAPGITGRAQSRCLR